jgi:hypothetical protein
MPFTEKPPPLPPPDQPLVNLKTGLISGAWYEFLKKFVGWLVRLAAAIP